MVQNEREFVCMLERKRERKKERICVCEREREKRKGFYCGRRFGLSSSINKSKWR